jgi:hypothetical protein
MASRDDPLPACLAPGAYPFPVDAALVSSSESLFT